MDKSVKEARESVQRLTRDLVKAASSLSEQEARWLVDGYYMMQEDRQRAHNQVRSMPEEPHSLIRWLAVQSQTLENQIKRALDEYSESKLVGRWLTANFGIGPVIAAGLLAHIHIGHWCGHRYDDGGYCHGRDPDDCAARQKKHKLTAHKFVPIISCPTVGHIWRFAGLDPTLKWLPKTKRPWNASLRTLCWKIGQSFMKFSNDERCVYGHVYRERKQYEIDRNESGGNAETAARILTEKKFDKDTEAYKAYSVGKLPPAQINARARRYATKLFLSHLHLYSLWHYVEFKTLPPKPYALGQLDHAHFIRPQHLDMIPGLVAAMKKAGL